MVGRFHGADSMECYTNLRNIQDLFSDGKTPYERRFGEPFNGPIIPFGSLVEYFPISAKDQSRIHQFGKKVLPGLFLGYALYAVRIWKGDKMVADVEELEKMDASEIYSKRLNAKEVIFPKEKGESYSQTNKIRWRGSGTENIHLYTGSPKWWRRSKSFSWESESSSPPLPQDSLPDAGEARNDFWSIPGNLINRHHVEPRVKTLLAKKESFLFH